MAPYSSVLAWRIPGMGSHRVGHDSSDLAAAAAYEYGDRKGDLSGRVADHSY